MNFIKRVFSNQPGRLVLYFWIYPAMLVLVSMFLCEIGCTGGIEAELKCAFAPLAVPCMIYVLGQFYLIFFGFAFAPVLIIAIMRAVKESTLAK